MASEASSSVSPSQSLSRSSQISDEGSKRATQVMAPSQAVRPSAQMPEKPVSQSSLRPAGLSSIWVSQSLSMPSHSSVAALLMVALLSSQSTPRQAAPRPYWSPSASTQTSAGMQMEKASAELSTRTQSKASGQSRSRMQGCEQMPWSGFSGVV